MKTRRAKDVDATKPSWRFAVPASVVVLLGAALLPKDETLRMPFGIEPNTSVFEPELSDNGRWLAFRSNAQNLVEGGSDGLSDVFLVDLKKGDVVQVTRTLAGGDPSGSCVRPAIDPSGRFVGFDSADAGLVEGDGVGSLDVFLFDRKSQTTVRVSVDDDGDSPGGSTSPAISKGGRWVAFSSTGNGLVDGDFNNTRDVFLRDMKKGVTTILSVPSTGGFADAESDDARISANGRWVAFVSSAALLPEDDNGVADVYRVDTKKHVLELVSANAVGVVGDQDSGSFLDMSANGRWVTFTSGAQNLVSGATPFVGVYRRDMMKGIVELVGTTPDGDPSASIVSAHAVSPDGRFVAFLSVGDDFGPPDTNAKTDVYLKDTKKGTIERISLGFAGVESDGTCGLAALSKKAKVVAFESSSTNLLEGDDENASTDVFVRRR